MHGHRIKASLSAFLQRVKAGEEVIVTERGRPIAKLTPVVSTDILPEHLAEMEKQGLLKRGSGKILADFWDFPRPEDPAGHTLKAVLQEREEGW